MPLPEDCCDDILTLHRCLEAVMNNTEQRHLHLDIDNSGTAMRFLTAFLASRPTTDVTLTGCKRMQERPIGELVVALRQLGADIDYVRQQGYPPLHIKGRRLDMSRTVSLRQVPSTQFVSALLLIGARVETDTCSPYIDIPLYIIPRSSLSTSHSVFSLLSLSTSLHCHHPTATCHITPLYHRNSLLGGFPAPPLVLLRFALHAIV